AEGKRPRSSVREPDPAARDPPLRPPSGAGGEPREARRLPRSRSPGQRPRARGSRCGWPRREQFLLPRRRGGTSARAANASPAGGLAGFRRERRSRRFLRPRTRAIVARGFGIQCARRRFGIPMLRALRRNRLGQVAAAIASLLAITGSLGLHPEPQAV